MKSSKSAANTVAAPKAPKKTAGARKGKRRRQTGVRSRVLDLLASGPRSSAELVAKGGFSAASLYLNLKALKREGVVETERKGRTVSIRLKGGARKSAPIEGEVVSASEPAAKSAALVSTYGARDLHAALEGLTRRLSPVERAQEKMLVLDQLSRSVPAPVASVLRDIIEDVLRLSASTKP